jgi:hypothetical protein
VRLADIAIVNFGLHYDIGYPYQREGIPPYHVKMFNFGQQALHHRLRTVYVCRVCVCMCVYVCVNLVCMCVCVHVCMYR